MQPTITNLQPAIDEAVLARVLGHRSGGEIIALYLSEAGFALQMLRAAVQNGNSAGLREAAHRLKGSSGYVGARGVQTLSAELEQIGRSGAVSEAATTLLSLLEDEFEHVCRRLESAAAQAA